MQAADQFEATIVWMDENEMLPGRPYWLKIGAQTVSATVQQPKYQVSVNTMEHLAAKTLELNAIGVANIATDRQIPFEPYADNRNLGGFILIDKMTNATVAAGMIHFALRRAENVHWQATDITREHHAALKNQKPAVLWLTGLSGAGKSTIANLVEKKLARMNRHTFLLDGDNVRHGLNKDLGLHRGRSHREHPPRRRSREAHDRCRPHRHHRVHLAVPRRARHGAADDAARASSSRSSSIRRSPTAEARDVKGLYKKARAGQLKNFTGIDSPYEPPSAPEIHIDTTKMTPEQAAEEIVKKLIP